MVLSNITVGNNTAYSAAGIGNLGIMMVANSGVSNNSTTGSGGNGGGISNARSTYFQILGAGTLTLRNTTVSGNTGHVAGGIINGGGGILTIRNSTINGNTADFTIGGGIVNQYVLDAINSTVSGNSAKTHGGGIYNTNIAALANVTIANNQALTGQGGGIYNGAEIQIEHTLLANNVAAGAGNNCTFGSGGGLTCEFRSHSATDSMSIRPPVPRGFGH
jgi:predicted outer membrane repeat protein